MGTTLRHFFAFSLLVILGASPALSAPVTVGNVTNIIVATNAVTGNKTASFGLSTGGSVEITPYAPDVVRVNFHWVGPFETEQVMIAKPFTNWATVSATFSDLGATYVIATAELDVEIQKSPFKVHFKDKSGFDLLREDHMEFDSAYNFTGQSGSGSSKLYCQKVMPTNQAYFGLGEYGGPMNRRGRTLECWNIGTYNWGEFQNPTYLNIPFFYGLQPASGGNPAFVYGVFFHNPCRPKFKFGTQFSDKYSFEAGDGRMDYYFFGGGSGHTMAKVIDRYSELTGRPTFLPKWGLGHHLSRFSYDNQGWVEYIANEATAQDVPLDAVYLDIDYMDANHDGNIGDGQLKQLTFNSNFANPAGMINYCNARGVKVVPLIEPWLEPGDTAHYNDANSAAHFIKDNNAVTVTRSIYVGNVSWFDYSSTPMQDWWMARITNWFANVPMAGIWNDLTEPEGGDQIPYNGLLWCDGRYGVSNSDSRRQWSNEHNHFGLRCAQQSYRTMLARDANKRPFVLSRSGNAGLQRYAVSWSGDTRANWFYQRATIRFGMGAMIAGASWYGNDVGGFAGTVSADLMTRSTEYNCLTPFFRNHADKSAANREPWRFDDPYKSYQRDMIKFRYRLMPYLYTLAYESTQSGEPMNVPPAFDYYADVNTHAESSDYNFLVGDFLLSAPVYNEGAGTRSVYLPYAPGLDWYYWPSGAPDANPGGTKYGGGQTVTVNAPLGKLPLFVRSGAIIPMGPSMQFANQFQAPWMDIHCWPSGNSEFTLHEDDGETFDYQGGEYARVRMVSSRTANDWTFDIQARQGSYNPGARDFYVYCFNPPTSAVQSVSLNGTALGQVADFNTVTQGWKFTPEGRMGFKIPDTGAAKSLHVAWVATNNTVQFTAAAQGIAETGGTVRIFVSRVGSSNGAVSVNFATSNGTAVAGSDYTSTNGTLNWGDGDVATKFFDVLVADDATYEDDETFSAILSGPSGASLGSPAATTVTISDNELPPGMLQFSASAYSASETGGTARIFVYRVLGSAGVAGVTFSTTNGSAAAGSDYTATNTILSWADGDTSTQYVDVAILDDGSPEGDETFDAKLSGVTGALLGGPATTTVTIVDNEQPPGAVQFVAASYAVAETAGTVRVYVSRTGGAGGPASVNYATSNGTALAGTDYTAAGSTLNWADTDASTQFIDIAIANDGAFEPAENFSVLLSGATGASLGSPSQTLVTITGLPLPDLLITNPPTDIVVSSGTTTYDVQGVANPSNWVGLVWTNGLTGASGTGSIGYAWTLNGLALGVGTNVFTVTATNAGSGTDASDSATNAAYSGGWTNGANGGSGWAGGWLISTTASSGYFLSGPGNANNSAGTPSWGLWASANGLSSASRTFAAPMAVNQDFSLRFDNNYIQNGGSVGFGLQNAAGSNLFEFLFAGGDGSYTVNDDINDRNTGIGYTSNGLDIAFRLTNSSQYRLTVGTNIFAGSLKAVADQHVVRFRAFNFNAGGGGSFDFFFNNIALTGGTAGAGPSTSDVVQIVRPAGVTPGTLQFASSTYTVSETGGFVRVFVSRTGGSDGAANVNYVTSNGTAIAGSDYTPAGGTLNWLAGDSTSKFFDVTVADDASFEGSKTFQALLGGAAGAALGSATSTTVTITDDEILPELLITNPPTDIAVGSGTTNVNLQGLANTGSWSGLTWTNSLTGASGVSPISTFWTIAGVVLNPGTNVITVTATNAGLGGAAADNATNAAYNGGWTNGANGGSGWGGGWSVTGSANSGYFIAGPANTNNSAGVEAWGLWANNGQLSTAVRPFAAPLNVGQDFSLRFDNNWVTNGGVVGFGLQNTGGENLFEFFFPGGSNTYFINDSLTNRNSGIPYFQDGWDIAFRLTNATQYRLEVGTNVLDGTLRGAVDQGIARFRAFNFNSGSGGHFDYFFNDLSISGNGGSSTSDVVQVIRSASQIPQPWRDQYNLVGPGSGDTEDFDDDGLSNLEEYWADTIPTNGTSLFGVVALPAQGPASNGVLTVQIQGPTTNSREYGLLFGSNLLGTVWLPTGTNQPGDGGGGPVTFAITNLTLDPLFIRARVVVP